MIPHTQPDSLDLTLILKHTTLKKTREKGQGISQSC